VFAFAGQAGRAAGLDAEEAEAAGGRVGGGRGGGGVLLGRALFVGRGGREERF